MCIRDSINAEYGKSSSGIMYHPGRYIKGNLQKWLCCSEKSMDHPGCTPTEGGEAEAAPPQEQETPAAAPPAPAPAPAAPAPAPAPAQEQEPAQEQHQPVMSAEGTFHPGRYIKGAMRKWMCCGEKSMDHPGCTTAGAEQPAAAAAQAPEPAQPAAQPQQMPPQQQQAAPEPQQQPTPPAAIRAPTGVPLEKPPLFAGRVAVVTGAASPVGLSVMEELLKGGAQCVLVDTNEQQLNAGVASLNSMHCLPITGDCAQPEAAAFVFQTAAEHYGKVDIVVCCSDTMSNSALDDISLMDWNRMLQSTMTSCFVTIQEAQRVMIGQGYGRIVIVGSVAGRSVAPLGGVHYAAAQAGLLGITRAAAKELAPHGITVNAVCPGLLDIPSTHNNLPASGFRLEVMIKRLGAPQDVASTVAFLASEPAGYITGASLDVNGGGTCL
eukprot:TRINITY_DN8464_c0_g1_i1.p1 TRINITY_DN8464_c0_g1~~TRINITY_DN8464_c0_g1_i1.p1  ORF type:complete len:437 (+),score=117.30 TRINITY_DN8464_c0_g1_i1:140-1450(+)